MSTNSATVVPTRKRMWPGVATWAGLAALMLLTRPYRGIYHDAHLYAAQTLNRLGVGEIDRDIIFAHGNQDSYTVFTLLYAPLVQSAGLPLANTLAWALALICWLAAMTVLAQQLFSDQRQRLLAMVAVVVLTPHYGSGVLAYGEGFVAPRPFAEALGMLAITACLRRKHLQGGLLVAAAMALQPLTGLSVAALWAWLTIGSTRHYLVLAVAIACSGLAMAGLGLEPFTWLLQSFDPEWNRLARHHSALAFSLTWAPVALGLMAVPVVSLLLVARRGPEKLARVARGVMIVSGLLLALSVVGADLLSNRFVTALQFWRVLALLTLIGNLLAVSALTVLPSASWSQRLMALALGLNAAGHLLHMWILPGAIAIMALLVAVTARFGSLPWARHLNAILLVGATVLILGSASFLVFTLTGGYGQQSPNLLLGLRLGLMLAVLVVLITEVTPNLRALAVLAGVLGAIAVADMRSPWQRYVDGPQTPPAEVRQMVSGRQVYWEAGLDLLWFNLNIAQYYSCRQKGGGLFFRGQAVENARRANVLMTLNSADFETRAGTPCVMKQDPAADGPVAVAQFVYVCTNLPELDLIVLRTGLSGLFRHRWELPAPDPLDDQSTTASTAFHFYHCADFRRL